MMFFHCLMCGKDLHESQRWRFLLTNEWTKTLCVRCENKLEFNKTQPDEKIFSLFFYNDFMKDFLHRYKFGQDVLLAHVFRHYVAKYLKKSASMIVPIPMHEQNKRIRTFAHVDEMLNAAAIPYSHVLKKTTTETRVGKNRVQRMESEKLFDVIANVNGKQIMLVDDIYTTGTTISHAKEVLLENGAKDVCAWTLIHG